MPITYAQRDNPPTALEAVRVGDAMHSGVVTCAANASLAAVARAMAAHRIHAVVVPSGGPQEWNVVSDVDLMAAVAAGRAATAGELASRPGIHVTPADALSRAIRVMNENAVHHLLVLSPGGGRPVGILSTLDIADVVAEFPPHEPDPSPGSGGTEAHDRVDAAGL